VSPLLEYVHHDGSEIYVSNLAPAVGEQVTVRLRVPRGLSVDKVLLRVPVDAEPEVHEATLAQEGADSWWSASFTMHADRGSYRWLLVGGDVGYRWVTAAGMADHEVTDATDFQLAVYERAPEWWRSTVAYQIFPDRFAKSAHSHEVPDWAVPRDWQTHPEGRSPNTAVEYYGGDLWGIIDHLDHLVELGATMLYTTPFFPARSTHRYDAATFAHVDPLLGGDEALIALVESAHERGLKVIGDITLNHSGDAHEWFLAAQAGDEEKRSFYYFSEDEPYGYATWLGVKSLPKFNFTSARLREELITGEQSVLRRYLRPPFQLDGWRVDVANMTARKGNYDANAEIARLTRQVIDEEGPGKILIGEHNHNAGPDLPGDGWHGNMNYTSFQRPIWAWLGAPYSDLHWMGKGVTPPSFSGRAMIDSIRTVHASTPWKSLAASWNLLGSHDSARIRTCVGSRDRHLAAAALLFTMPGTPMVFAEDEIGAEGSWGEDSRTAFPWHAQERWDRPTLSAYQALAHLRTTSRALAEGGLRFVHIDDDQIAYLRESADERLLVAVAREPGEIALPATILGIAQIDLLHGEVDQRMQSGQLVITFAAAGGAVWRIR
jgi:alpha-glucosidase